jgi:restriction system protein
MPVPEFFRFLRPTLELLSDDQNRHMRDIEAVLADQFRLSPEEREELIPSGRHTRLYDRTTWALTYLRQAKLIESAGRGVNKITERGRGYLKTAPDVIKPEDLHQFPEFADFKTRRRPVAAANGSPPATVTNVTESAATVVAKVTPEEAISAAYAALNDALAQDLLDRVKAMPPAFFEQLIVKLMLRLGYGGTADDAGQTLGKSSDGGVDGVINQDKLGLEKIYLQAKRWTDGTVGRPEIVR